VGDEDLILLSVEVFDLRDRFSALCHVLAGPICAVYEVVTLFPDLEKLLSNDCNHRGGPCLSGKRNRLYPMLSEMYVLKSLPFLGYTAVEYLSPSDVVLFLVPREAGKMLGGKYQVAGSHR
jgi:hypothetical protein